MNSVPAAWSLIPSASVSFAFASTPCRLPPCNSEARIEFGDMVASRLKLSPDGKIVLWPQPSDDPEDPQNVRLCPESITDHGNVDFVSFSGPNGRRPSS
jgi:hypothetical protein